MEHRTRKQDHNDKKVDGDNASNSHIPTKFGAKTVHTRPYEVPTPRTIMDFTFGLNKSTISCFG
jgi:hypothetical protein